MKKSLLFSGLGQIPEQAKPETPAEEARNNATNFVGGQGCAFRLEPESKKILIWIYGPIHNLSNYQKIISLLHAAPEDSEVHIYLHTPGGSINVTFHILTAMSQCKATIITRNIGMAASCGSLILSFGDKISVAVLSITMFHNALSGMFDSLHKVQLKIKHTVNRITDLFQRLIVRGLVSKEEVIKIVDSGEEFFIPSKVINERLEAKGLKYEEDK